MSITYARINKQAETTLKTQGQLNDAALKQRQLEIRQSQIVLKTQEEAQRTSLKAQELGIEQGRLTLEIQQSQRGMREQELAHEVEIKKHETEKVKQQVVLNQQQLEKEKREAERAAFRGLSTKGSIEIVQRLAVDKEGTGRFLVLLQIEVANHGKDPLEISLVVLDLFLGKADPALDRTLAEAEVLPLALPPVRTASGDRGGSAIRWERKLSYGSVDSAALSEIEGLRAKYVGDVPLTRDSWFIGSWNPGERTFFSQNYLVSAATGSQVAVTATLFLNRGRGTNSVYSQAWTAPLQ
jgi:hypothetical protein